MEILAKIIKSILKSWNLKTNQRYWYEIRFSYSERGVDKFEWVEQIGVLERCTILDRREIKKSFPPLHKRIFRNKTKLNNGVLVVTVVCYLGKFSQKNSKK